MDGNQTVHSRYENGGAACKPLYSDSPYGVSHLSESTHKEERHVHEEPVAEFLRCVTGWLHGTRLSTSTRGLHTVVQKGVTQSGVDNAMRACGYTNLDGVGDKSPIDVVLTRFYCMKDAGFKRKDNLDMCKLGRIGESAVCDGRR